jgi:Kef-type K+ transport system membrane component KefB
MHGQESILGHLPIAAGFALVMVIILVVPLLCERVRIPGVVGLLAGGLLLGPYVLGVISKEGPTATFLGEIGKLMLMFFAGLEIDISQFIKTKNRSIGFGSLTFALPLVAGTIVARIFGYEWVAAIFIGSLLASHTLLAYPIAEKLGIVRNEAVTVTIGATIFTDIAALMVLALCIPIHKAGFSLHAFLWQIGELILYVPFVIYVLGNLGHFLYKKMGHTKEGQFMLMMLIIGLAAWGAELINLEGIIGAFLAGLAVNRAVKNSAAKEELEFFGNNFFIPIFFIKIGTLINPKLFLNTFLYNSWLVLAIIVALLLGKWLAAFSAQKLYGYSRNERVTMWSLSLPQVAATLAAALVAFQAKDVGGVGLIDEPILNCIIVLMVITATLGPILTEIFGKRLVKSQAKS